jgi:hypothetical protein
MRATDISIPVPCGQGNMCNIVLPIPESRRARYHDYPTSDRERATDHPEECSAAPYLGRAMSFFIHGAEFPDHGLDSLGRYATSASPAQTHRLNQHYFQANPSQVPLGSADRLAVAFILGSSAGAVDWNIDADRGYGFKYWRHAGGLEGEFSEGGTYRQNPEY